MNRQVFKTVWNASTRSWVAAPETAKSHSHSCRRVSKPVSRLLTLPGAVAACFRLPALVIGVALLPQGAALAANLDWIEPGTGDWAVGANWSLGSIPGSADDVSISNGGTAVIDGGTRQANFIRIGKGAGQEGTVVVDGNAQVTVSSETNVGSSGKGTLILNSGTVASNWAMRIGENTGSEGRVVVNGGHITNATDNNFVVGRGGKGLLEVNNSGWVSSDWAFIGGEIWRASLVGQGTGTVVLNNTALFDNRAGIVFAAGAASKGSATLNDNSTMTTNNAMYLGYDGQADITVNGGLVNSNTHFYVGTNAGSSGELTVNQGGTVQAGGNFYAGYTGSGKVNVNGGVLQATAAVAIGFFAAGKGEVTVSQGGSFSTNSSLYVGNNGTGKLTLDDGLVHAGGAVWVGSGGSSQGTLILNGGVLETNQLSGNLGSSQVSFNGGTLRALADNPDFISSIGSPIQVGAGGMTVDTNGKAAGITSSLASAGADATLIKTGAGSLAIAANNSSFSGNVLVQQGSLNLAYAQTFANAASVTLKQGSTLDTQGTQQTLRQLAGATGSSLLNSGLLQLYTLDATESTFSGIISGTGSLTKNGAGQLNLAGNGSTQGSVFVQQGTLNFVQDGVFTTTGDYRTGNGAVSYLGFNNATLNVGGSFVQEQGSTLKVILGANPDIVADRAELDGFLVVEGFADTLQPVRASEIGHTDYTVIRTASGITGNFQNNPLAGSSLDYLLYEGSVSPDTRDYKLGFSLAWTEASQAQSTGSFTMNEGTGFNVDVALSDQTVPAGGFDSGWDGRSLSKSGAGTLILSQQNTYSGSTTLNEGLLRTDMADSLARSSNVIINGGTLDLNGKAQHLNRLSGSGGEIRLSGADLTIQNATAADSSNYAGTVSGAGNLIKDGTGSLTLSGQTLWSGETRLEGGALILDGSQGGAQLSSNIIGQSGTSFTLRNGATLSGTIDPTDVSIDAASTWIMTGNSDVETMSLAGRIGMTPPAQPMTQGRTLTAQNWVGQGGTVSLYSVLGGDNSVTDRIIIDGGRATGNTRLDIHNLGGLGARTTGDGIKVVDTKNGGMTDIEAFRLASRVAAGAYEYRLFRQDSAGQGENWYLRSGRTDKYPEYRNEVPLAMTLPALANRLGVDMLGTYHDRTGGREGSVAANGQSGTAGWGRVFGRSGDVKYDSGSEGRRYSNFREYGPSYDVDTSGFQVGTDLFRQEGADGQQNLAGVYVSFGQADGKVDKVYGGRAGKDDMNGYSIGAYWTHLAPQGWYTDTVVQATYYGQAEARSVEGEKLDSRGWGLAASIEGGYPFQLGGGWNLEPQAQLIYQTTRLEGGKDSFGRIDIDNTSAVYGRIGARLSKPVELESGTKLNTWARANLWNTFGSDGRITFSDREGNNSTTLSNSLGGSWTQVGVGVSGEVNKTTVVFAGVDYEHALGDGKGSSIGGRVGVNILW